MKRMWSKNELKNIADNQAKEVIESGLIDNAKPIYCHPLYMTYSRTETDKVTITCLIFNNDNTPFTKDTFKDWALNLFNNVNENASIMASGYVKTLPTSRLKKHPVTPATSIAIEVPNSAGSDNDYYTLEFGTVGFVFVDGVNPLNNSIL